MNVENYRTYFWIKNESAASGRIYVKKNNSRAPTLSIQYSTDLSTWTTLSNTSTTARYVTADAGQKVYFRATAEKWGDLSSGFYYNYFYSASGITHSVGGNIMSLLYGANFVGQTTFPNEDVFGIFNGLFVGDTDLISAGELVLPVTHIESTTGYMGRCCYRLMFSNCSNLEYGPQVDLRFKDINNPIELNKCMQGFLQYCSKLKTIHVCLQNCNDCFDVIFTGAVFEGLIWYDYSGKPMDSFPQNVTCVNIISMYLPTYDRVIDWQSNTMGRIYQVTDSNNDIIYKKEIVTPDDMKYLADTYDTSYPSSAHEVVIKNISDFTATITLTTRATTKLSQDNTYTYGFTYYDNSGTSHQLTFSIDNLSYDINIAPGEVISANFVPYSTNPSDLLGYTPPLALSSTQYIALLGGGNSVNERIPFQFDNSSKIVDASHFEWTINNTIVMSDETTQGNFMNLFSGSSHLVYPAKLNWDETTVENYHYLYGSTYQNCTNLRRVETIKVPSSGYNFRMCYRTYQGCTRLTNVDNAFVFKAAVSGGQPYVNNYASRNIAYSGNVSGYGIITQILDRTCYQTFSGCTGITSAKFSLPWAMCWRSNTLITQYSYYQMFNGCTSLVEPPKLERVYCADGGDYNRGFLKGAYNGIFRNCTSLNKLVLVAGNTTRWYCPDYEYSFVGGSWTQSTNKTNLTEWLNPAQSGTIYYKGNQPREVGTPSDGYLPNWTFTTNDWF